MTAEILRVEERDPSADAMRYAADFLSRGCVVAIPTDTFYGLAADPFNLSAVEEIFRVKGRPEERALPILVSSVEQAISLTRDEDALPPGFMRLAERYWPGALTLVVEAAQPVPLKVTANTGKVALRWPRSAVTCKLIEAFDGPVTGTSANLSGMPACASAGEVMQQLGGQLPLILDAGISGATLASTIVELQRDGWKILREGVIPREEIERLLR